MIFKRTISRQIQLCIKQYPVVFLTGPRKSGKTTEALNLIKEGFSYVSLNDFDERELALQDPKFFLCSHPWPLIIDEVQHAPILLEAIAPLVNHRRLETGEASGMFVLISSQSFDSVAKASRSLAGRAAILEMLPLSAREIDKDQNVPFLPKLEHLHQGHDHRTKADDLFQRICRGFYPELCSDPGIDAAKFYNALLREFIEQDVSEWILPSNRMRFMQLMQHLASWISSSLNCTQLSKAIGIDPKTIRSWISILEKCGILFLLPAYCEPGFPKRIAKAPKIYFCDTGLAAALAKVYSAEHLQISALAGPFLENYVIMEIRKSHLNCGRSVQMSYYRDSSHHEIDLIIEAERCLYPICILKGESFAPFHVQGFNQLNSSALTVQTGCILCNTPKPYTSDQDLLVLSCLSI